MSAGVALPDRVTVLTCIGCGAMGRQERCEGDCAEHKLVLVREEDYDALVAAAGAARAQVRRLAPVARRFAELDDDAPTALPALRERARRALRGEDDLDRPRAGTVTGWWCDRCGNVDMPQPCLGVCVWRPADWVGLALYERRLELAEPDVRAARALRRFLARAAHLTPRAGQWERNREALRVQALEALGPGPRRQGAAPDPGDTGS